MKRIIVPLLFLATSCRTLAQNDDEYRTVLLSSIRTLDTATSVKDLSQLAVAFDALYQTNKDWRPLYYRTLAYIRLSKTYTKESEKKDALAKANELVNSLPVDKDEVQVLRALYAMTYLAADHSEWQQYLPMIKESLKKAETLNAENPRVYYLKGVLTYNTPPAMGGGKEKGKELLKKSMEKYKSFQPADEFSPAWGMKDAETALQNL
jgi:hypothetical protein